MRNCVVSPTSYLTLTSVVAVHASSALTETSSNNRDNDVFVEQSTVFLVVTLCDVKLHTAACDIHVYSRRIAVDLSECLLAYTCFIADTGDTAYSYRTVSGIIIVPGSEFAINPTVAIFTKW